MRVFALVAHPDDIEFVMAGTLLRLKGLGWEVHYMNLADGCCGSTELAAEEISRLRLAEARRAAERLGAVFHPPMVPDMEVFYDKKMLARVAAVYREVAPDILLLHSLDDYMEDHMNSARLGLSAAFARGLPNFKTQPPRQIVEKPVAIYHAQPHGNHDRMNQVVVPELFVDISSFIEEKAALLEEHRSQKEFLDRTQGMNAYVETMRELGRFVGRLSGRHEYAEGWRRHNPQGFCDAKWDPLREALG